MIEVTAFFKPWNERRYIRSIIHRNWVLEETSLAKIWCISWHDVTTCFVSFLDPTVTARPAGFTPVTYGLERRLSVVVSSCPESINNGHKKTYVDQPKINRRPAVDQRKMVGTRIWHKRLRPI